MTRWKPISPSLEVAAETPPTIPQGLSLKKNFSWTLAGNVVYAGCQWGMLVVLAKLGTPEMVGQFALGLAITAPIFMFSNLQLRAVQATDARREYLFGHYLGLRLITTIFAFVLITVITFFSKYHWETTMVILAVGLAKVFQSVSDVCFGLLQQHERMDRIAISMMIKGPFSVVMLGVGVWLTGSVFWGALGLALAWAIILTSYDIRSAALVLGLSSVKTGHFKLQPIWDHRRLSSLVWLSLPLGLSMMMITLNTNIPRYFIHHYLGERELGLFAAMAYLMVAGGMVVGALGQSASPRLAKHAGVGSASAFRTLMWKLLGLGCFLGLGGLIVVLAAGKEILTIVYRPEYAEQVDVLFWLMLVAAVNYMASFLGYGMTALRYFRIQIPLFTLVSGTTAFLCFLLLPDNGLKGAAQALLVAALVQLGLTAITVWYGLQRAGRILKSPEVPNA
ncbi:MAG: oligosaccharide flippase family protein [Desulfobacteraceae bacterium]